MFPLWPSIWCGLQDPMRQTQSMPTSMPRSMSSWNDSKGTSHVRIPSKTQIFSTTRHPRLYSILPNGDLSMVRGELSLPTHL